MMAPEQRAAIVAALARYGASLSDDDHIIMHGEKVLSVRVEIRSGRLRMLSPIGGLIASFSGATPKLGVGVAEFVERFWYWKPKPEAT